MIPCVAAVTGVLMNAGAVMGGVVFDASLPPLQPVATVIKKRSAADRALRTCPDTLAWPFIGLRSPKEAGLYINWAILEMMMLRRKVSAQTRNASTGRGIAPVLFVRPAWMKDPDCLLRLGCARLAKFCHS